MDTRNENYSKVKGEQFAINVDGKPSSSLFGNKTTNLKQQSQNLEQQKYFKSHLMDKQVFVSSNATLGQMNKLYHLGILDNGSQSLHLTPIQSILQMKPSFEYFDIYEKKLKDSKDSTQQNETGFKKYKLICKKNLQPKLNI